MLVRGEAAVGRQILSDKTDLGQVILWTLAQHKLTRKLNLRSVSVIRRTVKAKSL